MLRAGVPILNNAEIEVDGTIGCFIHDAHTNVHYCLTAAHVYMPLSNNIHVGEPAQAMPTIVHAHPRFKDVAATGDVGLLVIDQNYSRICAIENLDMRAMNPNSQKGDEYDPFTLDEGHIEDLVTKGGQHVYKFGAMTGETSTRLTAYDVEVTLQVGTQKPQVFEHVIEATWTGSTFSEPGDSGCLWYLKSGSKIVPIGIHLGTKQGEHGSPNKSYTTLITHCAEVVADRLGIKELRFCSKASCTSERVGKLVY